MSAQNFDREQVDLDNLQVYDGLKEKIGEGNYTQGDVAEDYGKFEAINLVDSGVIADHGEQEYLMRESRIPEADKQAEYINSGPKDAAKAAGAGLMTAALPGVSGYMAISSGGDPLWVATSMVSTGAVSGTIRNMGKMAASGLGRRAVKGKLKRTYDLSAVAEEDYTLQVLDDQDFEQEAFERSEEQDVEVREPQVVVRSREVPYDGIDEELNEEMLEPDDEK